MTEGLMRAQGVQQGAFITLEGPDGCGKSTQARMLAEALSKDSTEVLSIREPGGTDISERIRKLLLDPANSSMSAECELLLYEASRAQLVNQVIKPACARNAIVICDRFYDSTYAYQAGARGLDKGMVAWANTLGSCGCVPIRTILLDLEPSIAFRRAAKEGTPDRLEAEGLCFQERVRAAYLELAQREPERICVVDASGSPEMLHDRIIEALGDLNLPFAAGVS